MTDATLEALANGQVDELLISVAIEAARPEQEPVEAILAPEIPDQTGGTAGLCQPVERDIFDCHIGCFWPAHVPDQLNHAPDWTAKCAAAQKDWRKIDLVFP